MFTDCNLNPSPPKLTDVQSALLQLNAAVMVETLFYGIHFVLFCICISILVRNGRPTQWFILAAAFVMFVLSTGDISITFRLMTHDIGGVIFNPGGPDTRYPVLKRFYEKDIIFVSNNFIAELILLYRCYMIWGRSKYLLVLTSFLVLGDTVWGYLSVGSCLLAPRSAFVPVYLWSVFAINIVISGITVGRIFWVSHIARPVLGRRKLRYFHYIIAILLESSAIYSACLLCFLILRRSGHQSVIVAIGFRVVAIMPTLLIVQVGLLADRFADSSDCEGPRTSSESVVLDTVVTTNYESQHTSGDMGMQTRDTLGNRRRSLSFVNIRPILRVREG